MIPRPAHIQGKLGKGIEPLDFRGEKSIERTANSFCFDHGFSVHFA
jgi:hypothetical protein